MHDLVQCLTVYGPLQAYLVLLVLIDLGAQQLAHGRCFQCSRCSTPDRLHHAHTRLPDLGFYPSPILTQPLQLLGRRLSHGCAHRSTEHHHGRDE